jgi:peptidyl-prolyl cis-trans isomerase C
MRTLACGLAAALVLFNAPAYAQAPATDPVLVEYGQVKLYRSEYEAELQKLPADIRPGFANSPRRVIDLLNRMIVQKALAAQAREQRLAEAPEFAARYHVELDRVLAQLRVAELEDRAGREFDARREQFESRARELYIVERKKYERPEQVSASHILFDLRKHSKDEALALANQARAKIAAGADFNQLAKAISEDPSAASNSGRLDFFTRADMDAAFAEAAFALKQPGDVSQPVLSQFGWHVIKLEQRRPAGVRSFDEVRNLIMADLRTKYVDDKRDAVVNAIRADPALKLNQDAVDALVIRTDPEMLKRLKEQAAPPPSAISPPASK